jgi:hypothetical protein
MNQMKREYVKRHRGRTDDGPIAMGPGESTRMPAGSPQRLAPALPLLRNGQVEECLRQIVRAMRITVAHQQQGLYVRAKKGECSLMSESVVL